MLTPSQFQLWCRRLRLPPDTCELLTRVRSSPPARRVQARATHVSGAYASRKMGCTIQFESHTVEWWAIDTMEHDPAVLEYYDQPTRPRGSERRNFGQVGHTLNRTTRYWAGVLNVEIRCA
jgi:putative transposase